jgi:excisionase family DNA binding protein
VAEQAKASSIRGLAKIYPVGRERISEFIRSRELPATRLGTRRYLILHADFEELLRRKAIWPEPDPRRVVEERLRREKGAS